MAQEHGIGRTRRRISKQDSWSVDAGFNFRHGSPFRLFSIRRKPVRHRGKDGGIAESGVGMKRLQALKVEQGTVFAEPVEALVEKARIMAAHAGGGQQQGFRIDDA